MKSFLKNILLLLLLSISLVSCKEDENPLEICGVEDPVENLPWLKSLTESYNNSSQVIGYVFYEGKKNGKRIFYLDSCCPMCSYYSEPQFFDCDGELITNLKDKDIEEIEWTQIWRSEPHLCGAE